jgi:hypothetical protein
MTTFFSPGPSVSAAHSSVWGDTQPIWVFWPALTPRFAQGPRRDPPGFAQGPIRSPKRGPYARAKKNRG